MKYPLSLLFAIISSMLLASGEVVSQEVVATEKTRSASGSFVVETPWLKWGLLASDWDKYLEILDTPRASFSPDMTPIQALGLSTTGTEQARYAMIAAKLREEFAYSDLVWQKAVITARNSDEWRLFHSTLYADYGDAGTGNTSWVDHPTEVYLFVDYDCITACLGFLSKAGNRTHAATHFFVGGAETDNDLRLWAAQLEVPIGLVASGAITLNHHKKELASLGFALKELPVAIGKLDGKYVLLQI